jgi:uncharacterized FlaG/YvyC family protein
MSENSIIPISSLRATEADATTRPQIVDALAKIAAQKSKAQEQTAKSMENPTELAENASDVSIRFRIDAETNQLTVFVIDRASRRVLRSIPASEFYKLQAGDLFKLTT